jgi:hypothetical protein
MYGASDAVVNKDETQVERAGRQTELRGTRSFEN